MPRSRLTIDQSSFSSPGWGATAVAESRQFDPFTALVAAVLAPVTGVVVPVVMIALETLARTKSHLF